MPSDFLEQLEGHYVSPSEIRLKCFSLANIIHANKELAQELLAEHVEAVESEDEDFDGEQLFDDNLVKLHHEFLEKEISQLLLYIAINFRTFDDKLTDSDFSTEYAEHKQKYDDADSYAGYFGINKFSVREACNKIIHADGFNPLEKKTDGLVVNNGASGECVLCPIPYLSGEVEFSGHFGKNEWLCNLYIPRFISTLIDVMAFSPSTTA